MDSHFLVRLQKHGYVIQEFVWTKNLAVAVKYGEEGSVSKNYNFYGIHGL